MSILTALEPVAADGDQLILEQPAGSHNFKERMK